MLVFGFDIPLVEIILTIGVITAIILLEAIIVLVLLLKHKGNGKSTVKRDFMKKLKKLKVK